MHVLLGLAEKCAAEQRRPSGRRSGERFEGVERPAGYQRQDERDANAERTPSGYDDQRRHRPEESRLRDAWCENCRCHASHHRKGRSIRNEILSGIDFRTVYLLWLCSILKQNIYFKTASHSGRLQPVLARAQLHHADPSDVRLPAEADWSRESAADEAPVAVRTGAANHRLLAPRRRGEGNRSVGNTGESTAWMSEARDRKEDPSTEWETHKTFSRANVDWYFPLPFPQTFSQLNDDCVTIDERSAAERARTTRIPACPVDRDVWCWLPSRCEYLTITNTFQLTATITIQYYNYKCKQMPKNANKLVCNVKCCNYNLKRWLQLVKEKCISRSNGKYPSTPLIHSSN